MQNMHHKILSILGKKKHQKHIAILGNLITREHVFMNTQRLSNTDGFMIHPVMPPEGLKLY